MLAAFCPWPNNPKAINIEVVILPVFLIEVHAHLHSAGALDKMVLQFLKVILFLPYNAVLLYSVGNLFEDNR
jgi:uncharacterized protein YqhQ